MAGLVPAIRRGSLPLLMAGKRPAMTDTRRSEVQMAYEHILTEVEDGVGTITLNRPDVLNAMNRKLSAELHDAVKAMDAHDAVGCIVITGAGTKAFSAGGDIHEQREDDRKYTFEQLEAMREGRRAYDISASAKPTIGMMNGLAYGGAAVLSSSLDMRIGC